MEVRVPGLGMAEGGGHFCSQLLLSHFGLAPDDLIVESRDFGPDRVAELLDGHLDAYIDWRGLPVPDLAEAFATGKLRLIPLEDASLQGFRLKHLFLVPWTDPDRYDYFGVFPNAKLTLNLSGANRLTMAFNRRVDRPGEPELRIFPKYDDPEILKVGNPFLRPQFTNAYEVGFSRSWVGGTGAAAVYHRDVSDAFLRIFAIDDSNPDITGNGFSAIYQNFLETQIATLALRFRF